MTGANGTTVPNIGKPAADPDPVTYSTDLNVRSFNGINTDQVKNPSLGTVSLKDSSESLAASYNDITAAAKLNGSGTIEDPFTVSSIAEYKYFEQQVNSGNTYGNQFVKLMRNLDFHHMTDVLPIGMSSDNSKYFSGTFDGNGKKLINLDINFDSNRFVGTFGTVKNATIKNLQKVGGEIRSNKQYVGGIIGSAVYSVILNCSNSGSVISTVDWDVGGIVGTIGGEDSLVMNCYNTGPVTGNAKTGGIAGTLGNDTIVDSCYNYGEITSGGYASGGIAGSQDNFSIIKKSYNAGKIHSKSGDSGGITGQLPNPDSVIEECYNVGSVSVENTGNQSTAGGISGRAGYYLGILRPTTDITTCTINRSYVLNDCVNTTDENIAGGTDLPIITNCIAKDSAYMQSTQFIADLNGSTLPYAWKAPRQTAGYQYPWLRWQMKDIDTVYVSDFGYRSWNDIDITSTSFEESGADASNAILIETPEDYKKLAEDVKSGTTYSGTYFKLANNLDFNNISDIISIGGSTPNIRELPFEGIFDGNNKIFFNVTIQSDAAHAVGIFGYCTGTIQNLGRIGGIINAPNSQSVGGIIGRTQFGAVIQNCYNTGVVYGGREVGGVVGVFGPQSSNLTSCYNGGDIHAQSEAGGITGGIYARVSDCYNVGNVVSETDFAGGISGKLNRQYPAPTITNCYNAGVVTAKAFSSGIFGGIRYNSGGSCTATNNYVLEGTAPQAVGDFDDAFDTSTCYMKDKAFMTDGSLLTAFQTAGSTAWKAGPNGYPILTWQN